MGKNFTKLKSKAFKIRLIKSSLLGAGLALFIMGLLFLLSTLELLIIKPIFTLLIGGGVLAASFALLYFLLYKSNSKFAKELDRKFELNEKVQTMLAFKDSEGAICELQRDDAESSLANVKIKTFDFKSLWSYLLCFVVGIAMLAVSFVIKPKEIIEPPPVVESVPFEITEIQIAALEELIEYVNASEMEEPYRSEISATLVVLLGDLKLATTVDEKDSSVGKAMDAIFDQTGLSSNAVEIINELWRMDTASTKALAKALNYYDWPKLDEWDKFVSKISEFRATLTYNLTEGEELNEEARLEATKLLFAEVSENIITTLTAARVERDDELYVVLMRLATANEVDEQFGTRIYGLQTLSEYIESLGYQNTQRELDATFTALNNEIFRILSQHKINTDTGEYAMTKLSTLFDYPLPKFERPQMFDASIGGESGTEDGTGGGGAISGGTEYGSDDLVFDPYTGKYVEYGVILDKYYALMFGKVEDGDYTEEEKAAMEKYFDILYGGFDNEDENTENENGED